MDKTPEGLHAEWRAVPGELRVFEQRFGVLLQETNDKAQRERGPRASGWGAWRGASA